MPPAKKKVKAKKVSKDDELLAERKIVKANKALNQGNHEKGIRLLSEAIKFCPNNAGYRLERGSRLLNRKMYNEAMKDAILVRTLEPGNIAGSILLAECHQAHGNFVLAENVLQLASSHEEAHKMEPLLNSVKQLQLEATRVRELYLQRNFRYAIQLCNELLSVAPEFHMAKIIKCLSLTMLGQHGKAGILVDSLLGANPWDSEALVAKAQLLYHAGKYDEADVIFEQYLVCPLTVVSESAKAVMESKEKFVAANDFAHAALKEKNYETAIQRYEDSLLIDVKHRLGNSNTHLILSMIHTKLRNLFKALDHCEQAIQLAPESEKAMSKYIELLEKLTFIDEALEQTERFMLQSDDKIKLVYHLERKQRLSRSQGHYFVLSVSPRASDSDIHAAYEEKMSYFASCENLTVVEAKMQFKKNEVEKAYSVLRDEKQRSQYDQEIAMSRQLEDVSISDDEFLAEVESVTLY
ncbi:DnaJ -like protein subfamily C member 7 [Halotydeus destructor]|nr:DnaJ -like protein subfamily C member 7 [Halotydeus destructor]